MSVARNTLYLTLASIAQKVIAFAYFTVLANLVGVEKTGTYFLTLSLIVMFSVIADWGITSVVIRETAADKNKATAYLRQAMGLKVPLILFAVIAVISFSVLLGYETNVIKLVALATPILAADALSVLFYGILRGLQDLRFEAIGIFFGQLLTAILGALVLWMSPSLPFLMMALLFGSLWNVLYAGYQVARRLGWLALLPRWNAQEMKKLLRISMAFGLAGVFVKIYSSVDTILLSLYKGQEAVGVYAVAYKFTYAFQFFPLAFVGALYPAMSSLATRNREALAKLFDRSMWYMALLAVPITFGIASTADLLIATFYPNGYSESVTALQLLIFVLIFLFLDFPVGSLLNAAHKQAIKTAAMGLTMVINILLNVLLIPRYGVIGACVSALISFFVLFVVSFWFVPSIIDYGWWKLIRRTSMIFFAGTLMAGTVLLLKSSLPLLLLVPIGATVYIFTLFLSGELHINQWRELRQSFSKSTYENENPSAHT